MTDIQATGFGLKRQNTSGIQPVEYKVLVLPTKIDEKTDGGIIYPDQTHEKEEWAQIRAVVVALGGNAFKDPDWKEPVPQIGDQIIMAKYAGNFIEGDDGKEYRIVNDKDIAAIRKE